MMWFSHAKPRFVRKFSIIYFLAWECGMWCVTFSQHTPTLCMLLKQFNIQNETFISDEMYLSSRPYEPHWEPRGRLLAFKDSTSRWCDDKHAGIIQGKFHTLQRQILHKGSGVKRGHICILEHVITLAACLRYFYVLGNFCNIAKFGVLISISF